MKEFAAIDPQLREKLTFDIGSAVYASIRHPLVQKESQKANTIDSLRNKILGILTGDNFWFADCVPSKNELGEPTIQELFIGLQDGKYTPLVDDEHTRSHLKMRSSDLLIEAVDDCIFWFSAISNSLDYTATQDDFRNHPTIASAISVNDTVHRVVKTMLSTADILDESMQLPRTHGDFVSMFVSAPKYFEERGIKLEIDTGEDNPPELRGRCPANTRDLFTGLPWHISLVDIVAPVYLADPNYA